MNVLSLFDGLSCGQLALKRAGIHVTKYYASEIDKFATQVTQKNFPDTIQLGDVRQVRGQDLPKIDLLIGGSPCQGFSFAGKRLDFEDPRSQLFFEYVRLLGELKPKYFLLENVKMKQECQDVITKYLGVEPIEINSSLVSAQNRKRLYWTNIPNVTQPEDRGLIIADILQHEVDESFYYGQGSLDYMKRGDAKWGQAGECRMNNYTMHEDKKSFTLTANFHKGVPYNFYAEKECVELGHTDDIKGKDILKRVYSAYAKSPTLTAVCGGHQEKKIAHDSVRYRKLTPVECERLQTLPSNYTEGVSNTQRYKMIGNSWTCEVIVHIFKGMK